MTLAASIGDLVSRGNALLANQEGAAAVQAARLAAMEAAFVARQSSLNLVVYVNATTGDDANTGTAAAPLKTLGRAVQMCPVGGTVTAWLQTDIDLADWIWIDDRRLIVKSAEQQRRVSLIAGPASSSSANGLFYLAGRATLVFEGSALELPPIPTTGSYRAAIQVASGSPAHVGPASVGLAGCSLILPPSPDVSTPLLQVGGGLNLWVNGLSSNRPMDGNWWLGLPAGTPATNLSLLQTNLSTL